MGSITRRLIAMIVGLALVLPVPATVALAADDLPLTGTLDVVAAGSTLEIDVDYRAQGRISDFTVRLLGPGTDEVLFATRDLSNEVAWAWSRDGVASGAYAVTVSATVAQGGIRRSGTAQRHVTIGGPTRPPPPVGAIAGVPEPQAVQPAAPAAGDVSADVVVYGGTPSGVMAAISAARPGVRVVLIEATGHVGGMMSNGLTATDYGHTAMIGGRTRQFFDRTQAIEGSAYGRYRFQPSTAEAAFNAMLASANVEVMLNERLATIRPVGMDGPWIEALRTESGRTVSGGAFVDASYEGDLMAAAGVSYRIGREPIGEFDESYAGVRASSSVFGVPAGIDPRVPLSAPGGIGTGDNRIQNSNYRLCFSSDPKNQVPFAEPEGYDPETYDLVAAYIASRLAQGHVPDITWFLWPVALPNNKFDVNNNGPVSIGLMGANTAYPDGSYATRASVVNALRDYSTGFLYFLGNDPRVPSSVRAQMAGYGLCADEFADNDNWPRLLYLREGRRMVGRYLLTQRDIEVARTKSDTIAVGSYAFDSHHVSRWIDETGRLRIEGGFWSGRANATRFSIPYRSLTPRANQATNLLVSVTASATHVANAALRLEPQYMMMGEAAGVAASLVAAGGGAGSVTTQSLDVSQLQQLLRQQGVVLDNYLFWDTIDSPFRGDIELTLLRGITFGCSAIYYCPTAPTTREVMAGFLVNALQLPATSRDYFTDDESSPLEDSINRLAAAGITAGCGSGRFCPTATVTRGQMAAFLGRAFKLRWTPRDYFTDDETSIFEGDINRLAESGITAGCGGTRFCPKALVSREQMAAFLWRAVR